jgi:hypothetical protein
MRPADVEEAQRAALHLLEVMIQRIPLEHFLTVETFDAVTSLAAVPFQSGTAGQFNEVNIHALRLLAELMRRQLIPPGMGSLVQQAGLQCLALLHRACNCAEGAQIDTTASSASLRALSTEARSAVVEYLTAFAQRMLPRLDTAPGFPLTRFLELSFVLTTTWPSADTFSEVLAIWTHVTDRAQQLIADADASGSAASPSPTGSSPIVPSTVAAVNVYIQAFVALSGQLFGRMQFRLTGPVLQAQEAEEEAARKTEEQPVKRTPLRRLDSHIAFVSLDDPDDDELANYGSMAVGTVLAEANRGDDTVDEVEEFGHAAGARAEDGDVDADAALLRRPGLVRNCVLVLSHLCVAPHVTHHVVTVAGNALADAVTQCVSATTEAAVRDYCARDAATWLQLLAETAPRLLEAAHVANHPKGPPPPFSLVGATMPLSASPIPAATSTSAVTANAAASTCVSVLHICGQILNAAIRERWHQRGHVYVLLVLAAFACVRAFAPWIDSQTRAAVTQAYDADPGVSDGAARLLAANVATLDAIAAACVQALDASVVPAPASIVATALATLGFLARLSPFLRAILLSPPATAVSGFLNALARQDILRVLSLMNRGQQLSLLSALSALLLQPSLAALSDHKSAEPGATAALQLKMSPRRGGVLFDSPTKPAPCLAPFIGPSEAQKQALCTQLLANVLDAALSPLRAVDTAGAVTDIQQLRKCVRALDLLAGVLSSLRGSESTTIEALYRIVGAAVLQTASSSTSSVLLKASDTFEPAQRDGVQLLVGHLLRVVFRAADVFRAKIDANSGWVVFSGLSQVFTACQTLSSGGSSGSKARLAIIAYIFRTSRSLAQSLASGRAKMAATGSLAVAGQLREAITSLCTGSIQEAVVRDPALALEISPPLLALQLEVLRTCWTSFIQTAAPNAEGVRIRAFVSDQAAHQFKALFQLHLHVLQLHNASPQLVHFGLVWLAAIHKDRRVFDLPGFCDIQLYTAYIEALAGLLYRDQHRTLEHEISSLVWVAAHANPSAFYDSLVRWHASLILPPAKPLPVNLRELLSKVNDAASLLECLTEIFLVVRP